MERNEIPARLFEKMKEITNYPNKVKSVSKMLDSTAFFPGGYGLWLEDNSTEFPTILILGQDFSTVKDYELMIEGKKKDTDSPTWKNLIKLLGSANIDLNKCYFSNVFMGLRDEDKSTGKFAGFKDKAFKQMNLDFIKYQINLIRPELLIVLGVYPAKMLGYLSPEDLDEWIKEKALKENNGIKYNAKFEDHICNCVALIHPSFRNSNINRRVYNNVKDYYTKDEAEVQMLIGAVNK